MLGNISKLGVFKKKSFSLIDIPPFSVLNEISREEMENVFLNKILL